MIKMPSEYKGKLSKKDKYKRTNARKWTNEEIEWCLDLRNKGYTMQDIAYSVDRTLESVSIKLKRLKKRDNTYNEKHIIEKYELNLEFIEYLSPATILDVYCGPNSWYKSNGYNVITNDIDESISADYHMDSLKFLCYNYLNGNRYDIIDLDPFGSCFNCLELAIQLANKGLCITLGEIGHKRFKRLDFVKRVYGIEELDDFTSDRMIRVIQDIAKKYKKDLIIYAKRDWKNISRVYFVIQDMKITEQWDKLKE